MTLDQAITSELGKYASPALVRRIRVAVLEALPSDEATVERVARALCLADGEDPQAFHTKAAYEAQDREGVALTDAAIPLWMSYRKAARAAISAIDALKETA